MKDKCKRLNFKCFLPVLCFQLLLWISALFSLRLMKNIEDLSYGTDKICQNKAFGLQVVWSYQTQH